MQKLLQIIYHGENWTAFDETTRKVLDMDDSFRKDKDLRTNEFRDYYYSNQMVIKYKGEKYEKIIISFYG